MSAPPRIALALDRDGTRVGVAYERALSVDDVEYVLASTADETAGQRDRLLAVAKEYRVELNLVMEIIDEVSQCGYQVRRGDAIARFARVRKLIAECERKARGTGPLTPRPCPGGITMPPPGKNKSWTYELLDDEGNVIGLVLNGGTASGWQLSLVTDREIDLEASTIDLVFVEDR